MQNPFVSVETVGVDFFWKKLSCEEAQKVGPRKESGAERGQWNADECLTNSQLSRENVMVCSVCWFLRCHSSHLADFMLP